VAWHVESKLADRVGFRARKAHYDAKRTIHAADIHDAFDGADSPVRDDGEDRQGHDLLCSKRVSAKLYWSERAAIARDLATALFREVSRELVRVPSKHRHSDVFGEPILR
jgi:hypothetical protein